MLMQTGVAFGGISCNSNATNTMWASPGTSGSWTDPTKWTNGVPQSTSDVCIGTSVTPYTVTVDNTTTAVANQLQVGPGATLNVKGAAGNATLTVNLLVFNEGAVQLGPRSSTFSSILAASTFQNGSGGTFTTAGLANQLNANILNQTGATFTIGSSSDLDNNKSSSTFNNSGGTVTVGAAFDVNSNLTFAVSGGAINGAFTLHVVGGTLDHTNGTITARTRLENIQIKPQSGGGTATLTVTNTGNTLGSDISTFDTVVLAGNTAVKDAILTSSVSRINSGTIRLSAVSNATTKTSKVVFTGGSTLTNNGVVQTEANPNAPMTDTTAAREITGNVVNNGVLTIAYPTLFNGASTSISQNLGTTNLNSTLNTTGSDGFSLTGGTLAGAGTLTGSLLNAGGTVAPGSSPGILTIDGSFTQNSGTLAIEIGGAIAGAESDRLAVTGTAEVNGTLALTTINAFSPSTLFTYDFVTYTGHSGVFPTITGTSAGGGKSYQVTMNANAGTLTVVAGSITRQPDGKVALGSSSAPYSGDNIYNLD